MIIFKGALSEAANKQEVKELKKTGLVLGCIVVPIGAILFSLGFLISDIILINIVLILFILTWSITWIATTLWIIKDAQKNHERIIEVTEDYILCDYEGNSKVFEKPTFRELGEVVEVHDFGDYYIIYFSELIKTRNFVCQKDLITEGTIEEFEALFEDKLIRQTDN